MNFGKINLMKYRICGTFMRPKFFLLTKFWISLFKWGFEDVSSFKDCIELSSVIMRYVITCLHVLLPYTVRCLPWELLMLTHASSFAIFSTYHIKLHGQVLFCIATTRHVFLFLTRYTIFSLLYVPLRFFCNFILLFLTSYRFCEQHVQFFFSFELSWDILKTF